MENLRYKYYKYYNNAEAQLGHFMEKVALKLELLLRGNPRPIPVTNWISTVDDRRTSFFLCTCPCKLTVVDSALLVKTFPGFQIHRFSFLFTVLSCATEV